MKTSKQYRDEKKYKLACKMIKTAMNVSYLANGKTITIVGVDSNGKKYR